MSGHLREFSRSQDFHRLSPQQLEHLLGCDFPVDCPEVEVLRIVMRWLGGGTDMHNSAGRLHFTQRLLRRVHFVEIAPWELETVVSHARTYHEQHLYRQVSGIA